MLIERPMYLANPTFLTAPGADGQKEEFYVGRVGEHDDSHYQSRG